MLHGNVFCRGAEGAFSEELAIPPAFLADTSAATLRKAIHHRAGDFMRAVPRIPQSLRILVLSSDSAKAMVKVAKDCAKHAVDGGPMSVHARCQMHMFWASLSAALKPFNMLSPMFCGATLLRKGHNRGALRDIVHRWVHRNLKVSYSVPAQSSSFNEGLIHILNAADAVVADLPVRGGGPCDQAELCARKSARQDLLKLLPWSWHDRDNFVHYCSMSCAPLCEPAGQPGSAAEKICKALDVGFFNCLPCVPALNRWNKVFGPLAWFFFCQGFFGIIVEAIVQVHESLQADAAGSIARVLSVEELIALSDTYQAVNAMRWKKLIAFFRRPITGLALPTLSVLFQVASQTLGIFFHQARMLERGSIKCFLHPATSPAEELIARLSSMLQDPEAPGWRVIDVSSSRALRVTSIALLILIGNVFLRCVACFDAWPWPLFKLIHESVPEGEVSLIEEQFMTCGQCCIPRHDGLTWPLRGHILQKESLRSGVIKTLLQDLLQCIPASNILTEDRFARVRRHADSNSGHAASPGTTAANHVLSEFSAMFETAVQRPPACPCVCSPRQRK